ncbi:MAG: energy-coupling factor transporter ATPase [Peptostreptococcaceae bacterium]|nr:energy-coupling factor transporter ATPase [Peptostreptococcaceae bacterium]
MSIQVKDLTHIYSEGLPYESVALKDVSFSIEDGEFVGVIGHTGSGKSTMVQHLNGLLKPHSGSIIIGDVDISKGNVLMRDIRRKIGLVFQYPEYQLFEETVHKDVAFGPTNLGLAKEEVDQRVIEAINLVGLDYAEIGERSPFELSGGQKRRVAIAGVIAMKPEVLILDEPTAGLDPKAHKDVLEMIKKIHETQNNITILVSHNMNDIAKMVDKVLVMEAGMIAMVGTPRQVFSQALILKKMGLALPQASELMNKLRNRGFDIKEGILTNDEAFAELVRILK